MIDICVCDMCDLVCDGAVKLSSCEMLHVIICYLRCNGFFDFREHGMTESDMQTHNVCALKCVVILKLIHVCMHVLTCMQYIGDFRCMKMYADMCILYICIYIYHIYIFIFIIY